MYNIRTIVKIIEGWKKILIYMKKKNRNKSKNFLTHSRNIKDKLIVNLKTVIESLLSK